MFGASSELASIMEFGFVCCCVFAASVEDRYDVANVLLRNGAKVNVEDKQGQTPLMLAVNNGFTAIADLFLQKNADINIKTAVQFFSSTFACIILSIFCAVYK